MLEAGVPFSVVIEIMGWSASTAVRMAKKYGHIGQSARRESVDMWTSSSVRVFLMRSRPKRIRFNKPMKINGSSGRTRTYNPPVNSPVRSSNFRNLAAQMTTHRSAKKPEGMRTVTLI